MNVGPAVGRSFFSVRLRGWVVGIWERQVFDQQKLANLLWAHISTYKDI